MKMRWISLLLLVLVFPLASSSIFIDPLKPIYNYGDQISVQTKIIPTVSSSGHYVVDLKCGTNFSSNIYNSFVEVQGGVEKPVLIATELLNPLLDNMTSPCFLKAVFGSESANSNNFVLSRLVNVNAEIEFESLKPGEVFYVSGTAIKRSGVNLDGFVELFIKSLNLYRSASAINGKFNLSITLPSNVKSGVHNFSVEVHNTDSNSRKINFGSYSGTFEIGQILKEVKIHSDNENVQPNSDFIFRVDTFDQAGDHIDKDVSLIVNKPKGVPYIKKVIKSGEDQKIFFSLNDTPGYWSIETEVDGILNRKLFYLSEINTLQTSLINNTLIVTNIGNSPYSGPIEITIGSFVEIKNVKLNPGETQRFTLRAPDGDYSISIMEVGGENKNLGSAFLTGNAIKVTDFKEDVIYTFTNPWIWWLGIILLVLIIVLVQIRVRMNKNPVPQPQTYVAPVSTTNELKPSRADFGSSFTPSDKFGTKMDMSWFNKPKTSTPSVSAGVTPSTVAKVSPASLFGTEDHGIRERAVAIALYANSPVFAEATNHSLNVAREAGARVYVDSDYKIILFSPRLTGKQDNESHAINVARRIQALFLEGMGAQTGLTFGIGVNDGEIISEVDNNKFHFTSTGNLISYAKRLAFSSNTKLLVSDSIRRKVVSTVKTERTSFQGVWEVVKVSDRSSSAPASDFLKRFSERNK